jgi:hypothetical protein
MLRLTRRRVTLASRAVCALLLAGAGHSASGSVLPAPVVTDSAIPFNAAFGPQNTVDQTEADYASLGQGVDTYVTYSFGAPQSFDKIVVINRNSAGQSDYIGDFTLTLDGSTTTSVTRTPLRGSSAIHSLGALRTATTVRLDVDTIGTGDAFNNTGAMEVLFVRTPAGQTARPATIVGAAPDFSPFYQVANAVDGLVGRSTGAGERGPEYASAGQGTNTFVDFDLGAVVPVGGFDFFDRPADEDRTTGFDMIFSQNPTFGDADDVVKSYVNSAMALGDVFPGISARYVRFDVTASAAANTGVSEMVFYQVPEPSMTGACAVSLLALLRRRFR